MPESRNHRRGVVVQDEKGDQKMSDRTPIVILMRNVGESRRAGSPIGRLREKILGFTWCAGLLASNTLVLGLVSVPQLHAEQGLDLLAIG